jgi:hypothetical protein
MLADGTPLSSVRTAGEGLPVDIPLDTGAEEELPDRPLVPADELNRELPTELLVDEPVVDDPIEEPLMTGSGAPPEMSPVRPDELGGGGGTVTPGRGLSARPDPRLAVEPGTL